MLPELYLISNMCTPLALGSIFLIVVSLLFTWCLQNLKQTNESLEIIENYDIQAEESPV